MHLFKETDLDEEFIAESGANFASSTAYGGLNAASGRSRNGGPQLVGTADLLAEQYRRSSAGGGSGGDDCARGHRNRHSNVGTGGDPSGAIVQLNDRVYWSANKANMTGQSHRHVFQDSLVAIYNRMHAEYPT